MATTTGTSKIAKLQAEFFQQLADFTNADELDYDMISPVGDRVLVKVFKFQPKSDSVGKSNIWAPNEKGEWVKSEQAKYEAVYPIVKIVRSLKREYKKGDLYIIPREEVVGDDWNDEFLHIMNNYVKQGKTGGAVRIPEGMRQRIPRLERYWAKYHIGSVDRVDKQDSSDEYVFLVPTLKLIAKYEHTF